MSSLQIKCVLRGQKNQVMKFFESSEGNTQKRGKNTEKFGTWDTRSNKQIRELTFNIKKLMDQYVFGLKPNKNVIEHVYKFFIVEDGIIKYFSESNMRLFIEKDIIMECKQLLKKK